MRYKYIHIPKVMQEKMYLAQVPLVANLNFVEQWSYLQMLNAQKAE